MKERYSSNRIDMLYDSTGTKLTTSVDIKENISSFYKYLIGVAAVSLQGVDLNMVRQGAQLIDVAAQSLIRHVTRQEIDFSLRGIDIHKAPRWA